MNTGFIESGHTHIGKQCPASLLAFVSALVLAPVVRDALEAGKVSLEFGNELLAITGGQVDIRKLHFEIAQVPVPNVLFEPIQRAMLVNQLSEATSPALGGINHLR
nr:hypothetical protein [uncultured Devosia sp.]